MSPSEPAHVEPDTPEAEASLDQNALFDRLGRLTTERRNPGSENLSGLDAAGIARLIHEQDRHTLDAVEGALAEITEVMRRTAHAFERGGRLRYFGAGTSGRLGILDASECPPTFGTDPELVKGFIAGGTQAIFRAVEGAEDDPDLGARDAASDELGPHDVACGLAASGRTPYVIGALKEAARRGAYTALITAVPPEQLDYRPDTVISLQVGPEVLMGSTRMKSGTAQKMALNMITTGAMVLTGKVYRNVMVDLQASNEKLRHRSVRTLMHFLPIDRAQATELLERAHGHVKSALLMHMCGLSRQQALERLEQSGGHLDRALQTH